MVRFFIIKTLRENKNWISGADLAKTLNLSRNAISKHIKTLKELGFGIESIPKKGYKFVQSPTTIYPETIDFPVSLFSYDRAFFFETLPSTNQKLNEIAESSEEGTLCLTENQTGGKGRKGRFWYSEPENSLCFSFVLRPKIPMEFAQQLTLLTAFAIVKTLDDCALNPTIKWPNDILIEDRKIAGILSELKGTSDQIESLIIGVGMNIQIENFPKELKAKAISLPTKKKMTRQRILSSFLFHFSALYLEYEKGIFPLDEIKRRLSILGKEIKVQQMNRTLSGVVTDILPSGILVLKTENGQEFITAGDIVVQSYTEKE